MVRELKKVEPFNSIVIVSKIAGFKILKMGFLAQNQKRPSRFCLRSCILIKIIQGNQKKLGADGGRHPFGPWREIHILADSEKKNFAISKISFLVNQYSTIPYWSTIEKNFAPQTHGAVEHFVYVAQTPIFSLETRHSCRDPGLGPRAKLYMAVSTYG